jgi:hypothetical protein
MADAQATEVKSDVPATSSAEELARTLAGVTKTVNEIQTAFGAKNKEELLAKAKAMREAEGSAKSPAERSAEVVRETAPLDQPKRPRRTEFMIDGFEDVEKYEAAMDKYEADSATYGQNQRRRETAEQVADRAIASAVKAAPDWAVGSGDEDDSAMVDQLVTARAAAIAAGDCATPEEVEQARQDVEAYLARAANRKLGSADAAAAAARAKDVAAKGGAGSPAASKQEDEPMPGRDSTPEEKEAYIRNHARKTRTA